MSAPAGSPEDRPHDAARMRLAHDMREARHHLATVSGLAGPVERRLTGAYARIVLRGWPYQMLLSLAVISAATIWQPIGALLPGAAFVLLVETAIAFGAHRFLRQPEPTTALRTWRIAFIFAEMALGASWLVLFWPLLFHAEASHAPAAHSFVLFGVMIVLGSTGMLRATMPAAVHAGMVPLTLAVLFVAFHGAGRENISFALLTMGAELFLLYFVSNLHQSAVATLRSRAEFKARLAELEEIKANTAHARQRAEEAERAKAQFLATVGHELRTPLNAILGFSEVMKNEVLGSHSTPSYREYASDIHGSGQHLLAIINEMLELSRIESGRYELNEERIRLADAVRAAADLVAEPIRAKGQSFEVSADETLGPLLADARAVRQIVLNLLSNASKFTPAGGRITVKAGWTSRGGQYVTIADNGPGIPADEIPVALSSFGRGTLAVTTAAQGAGLGLPIAKGLADLHGGRLILKSKPREGTEAVVIFPESRCATVDAAQPVPPAQAADAA